MLQANLNLNGKTVLVTGAAGFIGSSLILSLLDRFDTIQIVGIDDMNDYYDVGLKAQRLENIKVKAGERWHFIKASIADKVAVDDLFGTYSPQFVVNLAAQAGVRNNELNPQSYINSNIIGFFNVLEACRQHTVEHLVYASSSSVYGECKHSPFSIEDKVDQPVSLYAATKKSDELLAYAYSKLYSIPCTGLRFFTVYGPAGRPDMAYYSFSDKLCSGQSIKLFNYGNCERDFTFIDDIVEGIVRVMQHAPENRSGEDGLPLAPCKLYNIGNSKPVKLLDFVILLKNALVEAELLPSDYDIKEHLEFLPMQPGDVVATCADVSALEKDFGFKPRTTLEEGLRKFALWYKTCHNE